MTYPPTPTSYNFVPNDKEGTLIPATPEPQSLAFKAAQAAAYLSAAETSALAKNATVAPPIRVTTIDGVPTVFARPALTGEAGIAQQATDEDLLAMGERPLKFPVCEVLGCKGEGRYQIVSGAGKPLRINRKGELVFGDVEPVDVHGMSANDKARAHAGLGLIGVVGPSGQMARQAPKMHVDVCQAHQALPYAPQKSKPVRYQSGPFASHIAARTRAAKVGLRTRREPAVFPVRQDDGGEVWFVRGDDGVNLPQGITLTKLEA